MSELGQVKDNIQTFSDDKLLSEEEISLVRQVSDMLHGLYAVPCTGCRYCCAGCPRQLDIPFLLTAFNEYKTGGEKSLSSWRLAGWAPCPEDKRPSALHRLRRVYRPLSPGAGRARLYEGDGVVSVSG